MPRRYRRRRYAIARPLKTAKYSNETYSGEVQLVAPGNQDGWAVIVPQTQVLATRKVKNLTLRIGFNSINYKIADDATKYVSRNAPLNVIFAAVFVPQGTEVSDLKKALASETLGEPTACVSMYEPNQNVIMSGMVGPDSPTTVKTRLARNLNSGDQIYVAFLLTYNSEDLQEAAVALDCTANYAISY